MCGKMTERNISFNALVVCISIASAATNASPENEVDTDGTIPSYILMESSMTLVCNVIDKSSNVTWARFKENDTQEQISESLSKDRFKIVANNLTIWKFTIADADFTYLCNSSDHEESITNQLFIVIVSPIVTIKKYPTFMEDRQVVLFCNVSEYHGPGTLSINWKFGGTAYSSGINERVSLCSKGGVSNAQLTIVNSTMQDQGDYTCSPDIIISINLIIQTKLSATTRVVIRSRTAVIWVYLGVLGIAIAVGGLLMLGSYIKNRFTRA